VELTSWLGCSAEELDALVMALGYLRDPEGRYTRRRNRARTRGGARRRRGE
jgi:hypothetical protein